MSVPRPDPAPPAAELPLLLRLRGVPAVVLGGGTEADAKARMLVEAGAILRRLPGPELPAEALSGARLCVIALDDEAAASRAAATARAAGVLVNAVDRPALCDATWPAILRRGPVTVAIGTGGAAPALARELRRRIAIALPPGIGLLARLCGDWRARVARALPDRAARRRFWDSAITGAAARAALAGDAAGAEAALAACLAGAASRPIGRPIGRASLVGAGPGDPELLTLKAVRALQSADVILYDALVDPAVLDLARREARRIDVGKRCGRQAMNQAAINRLILRHVQAGAHVVRLKGGDPFVFGRGGEELAALRAAGAAVEIVPGVTAATAAAAALGVPLTHRDVSRSVHFVTGHGSDGALPAHDWASLVRAGGTLAAYMAARRLPDLVGALVGAGLDPKTPAAAVENASRSDERRILAPLGALAARLAEIDGGGPTLVLIGPVVALAETAVEPLSIAA